MKVVVNKLDEHTLSPLQREHLKVAREIAGNVPVYPASIHDSVPIIGAFHLQSREIFISPQRLTKLRWTVNTTIHEKAHAISRAADGTRAHDEAISKISSQVAQAASTGKFDMLLKEALW